MMLQDGTLLELSGPLVRVWRLGMRRWVLLGTLVGGWVGGRGFDSLPSSFAKLSNCLGNWN